MLGGGAFGCGPHVPMLPAIWEPNATGRGELDVPGGQHGHGSVVAADV
ncbi:hypothetical protein ABFA25_12370 [Mycobacterium lepromatosis]